MLSDVSSEPILNGRLTSAVAADSLCRKDSAADILSTTESPTEDSESEVENVALSDSKMIEL
jgi:hypothetical protein